VLGNPDVLVEREQTLADRGGRGHASPAQPARPGPVQPVSIDRRGRRRCRTATIAAFSRRDARDGCLRASPRFFSSVSESPLAQSRAPA
jgi:hypothetical protein